MTSEFPTETAAAVAVQDILKFKAADGAIIGRLYTESGVVKFEGTPEACLTIMLGDITRQAHAAVREALAMAKRPGGALSPLPARSGGSINGEEKDPYLGTR